MAGYCVLPVCGYETSAPLCCHLGGHGGEHVEVEGSWDNWTTRQPLTRTGKDFTIIKLLPPGVYQVGQEAVAHSYHSFLDNVEAVLCFTVEKLELDWTNIVCCDLPDIGTLAVVLPASRRPNILATWCSAQNTCFMCVHPPFGLPSVCLGFGYPRTEPNPFTPCWHIMQMTMAAAHQPVYLPSALSSTGHGYHMCVWKAVSYERSGMISGI